MTNTVLETWDDGMSTGREQSVWSVGARRPTEARQVHNWPMADVALDIPLYASDFEEGAQYPPDRAQARQLQLNTLRRLGRGDFTDFVDEQPRVTVNYFARLVEVLSALMVSTEPPADLSDQIQQMIAAELKYGRAYVLRLDDALFVPEPQNVWAAAEDPSVRYVVSQYVSVDSRDGEADRAIVYTVSEAGVVATDIGLEHGIVGGNAVRFGQVAGETSFTGGWAMADRPPVDGDWGTSAFTQLVPLVVPLCMRLHGIQHVLDYHESPTLIMPGKLADVVQNLRPEGAPVTDDAIGAGFMQRQSRLVLQNDSIWNPNENVRPEYLTWDGGLEASFAAVEVLKAELRMMTGVPAALEQEGGDVPSGAALREMFMVLYWTAGQLHSRTRAALEAVLGRSVDWESPFAEEAAPEAPETEVPRPDDEEGM
ncbi:MAG: hypothetical protein OXH38_06805 [Chloroflexi bacterium]|nr:hypothetical protein [Chloroflexota bacterium]